MLTLSKLLRYTALQTVRQTVLSCQIEEMNEELPSHHYFCYFVIVAVDERFAFISLLSGTDFESLQ